MPRKRTTEEFIQIAKFIHGEKYDYSKVEYKGNKVKVLIVCTTHGEFWQRPDSHLSDHGCIMCQYDVLSKLYSYNITEFIEKAESIHGDKYDYSKVEYINNRDTISISCPIHGEFEQKAYIHLGGCGCPLCNISKGETEISDILKYHNINHNHQHRFKNCRNKRPLPFDFYLPGLNTCIEYDGIQHFEPVEYFGGDEYLEYVKSNDRIKTNYCKSNNINLIRIRYDDSIEEKLGTLIDFNNKILR